MTISSTTSRNDYTGSDAVLIYAYSFRIFSDTDLRVTVRKISTGVETTLTKTTDYTVSGVGSTSGGNATLVNAGQSWLNVDGTLSSAYKLTIRRVRPLTQQTDIRNQGTYFPEIQEDALDHGIMVAQQQQDGIDRSVKLPETLPASSFSAVLPATLPLYPGSAIIVNATGDGFSLGATAADIDRIAGKKTFAEFLASAAAQPTLTRLGYATDLKQVVFYNGGEGGGDPTYPGWTFF
jgi:hypothetical protein